MRSVDKHAPGQRARVLAEVQALRAVKCPQVLGFHAWYETSNHLWLIVDLCVGGDLLTLLRTDGRVPEASAFGWARDVAAGLAALHAVGIVHCDVKPSNCLLDEHGRLKLTGLGLSRRIVDIDAAATAADGNGTAEVPHHPVDASITQNLNGGMGLRGTPAYMAPELFVPGGVPSCASDAWALGCLLYECLTGSPPFAAASLTELVTQVLTQHPAPLHVPASDACVDLLEGLLTKEPANRLAWPDLESHLFWGDGGLFDNLDAADTTDSGASRDASSLQHSRPHIFPCQVAFEAFCARRARGSTPDATADSIAAVTQQTAGNAKPEPPASLPTASGVDVVRLSVNARRNLMATSHASDGSASDENASGPVEVARSKQIADGESSHTSELRYSRANAASLLPVRNSTSVPQIQQLSASRSGAPAQPPTTAADDVPPLLPLLRTALDMAPGRTSHAGDGRESMTHGDEFGGDSSTTAEAHEPMAQNTGGIPLSTIAASGSIRIDGTATGGSSHGVDAMPGPGPADVALNTPDAEIDFSEPITAAAAVGAVLSHDVGHEQDDAGEDMIADVLEEKQQPEGRVSTSILTASLLDSLFPSETNAAAPAAAVEDDSTADALVSPPPPPAMPHRTTSADVSAFLQRRHTRAAAAVAAAATAEAAAAAAAAAVTSPSDVGSGDLDLRASDGMDSASLSSSLASLSLAGGHGRPTIVADCARERQVVWHASDSSVTPIVHNRRIEAWPIPSWDPHTLPFRPLAHAELVRLAGPQLDAFLSQVSRSIAQGSGASSGNTPPPGVASTLGYLDALLVAPPPSPEGSVHDGAAVVSAVANVLFNSILGATLVRVLRTSRQVATRIRCCALLGALARHSTRLDDGLVCNSGMLMLLVELLAPSVNERLRRRAMATLGELLFYAATQAAEEAKPDGENGSQPHNRWPFPGHTALSIARMLRHADDEIAQHYGAKTVENVATAGGPMAEMLAVPEVAAPLCVLAGGTTANSHLRATAASALGRLVRNLPPGGPTGANLLRCLCMYAPPLPLHGGGGSAAQLVASSAGATLLVATPARALAAGVCDAAPKVVLGWLNVLNMALLAEADARGSAAQPPAAPNQSRVPQWPAGTSSVADERGLYVALAGLLQRTCLGSNAGGGTPSSPASTSPSTSSRGSGHSGRDGGREWMSPVLRGKALLAWALLTRIGGPAALATACASGCSLHDVGGTRNDEAQSGRSDTYSEQCSLALIAAVSDMAPALVDAAVAGAMWALSRNSDAPGPPGAAAHGLAAVACLLASPRLAPCILLVEPPPGVVFHLPRLLALLSNPTASSSRAAVRAGVHAVLEAMAGGSPAVGLLASPLVAESSVTTLLPALTAAASQATSGDTRFLALRAACDVMLALLPVAYPTVPGEGTAEAAAVLLGTLLTSTLLDGILAHVVAALSDGDSSIPLYALKLLACVTEAAPPDVTACIASLGATERAFTFLELDHPCNNVHNALLCLRLAACPQVSTNQLGELGAPARCADVLAYAHDARVEQFVEPSLGMCRALVQRYTLWAASADEEEVQEAGSPATWGPHLLRCLPLTLELCVPDASVPDAAAVSALAAECSTLLVSAFPVDAISKALMSSADIHGSSWTDVLASILDALAAQAVVAEQTYVSSHIEALHVCGHVVAAFSKLGRQDAGPIEKLLPPLRRINVAALDAGVATAADKLKAQVLALLA